MVKAPPPGSNGTGIAGPQRLGPGDQPGRGVGARNGPDGEHRQVTTNPAETQGVQGFPAMMNAEQYIVDNHLATVISQSFGTAEEAFSSTQSLLNLRHAFVSAAANGVTVLASSGDSGTANPGMHAGEEPVDVPLPDRRLAGLRPAGHRRRRHVPVHRPGDRHRGRQHRPAGQLPESTPAREVGWIDAGGGFSHIFARPGYQETLPAGSTSIGAMRGVPDVALQASSRHRYPGLRHRSGDATAD